MDRGNQVTMGHDNECERCARSLGQKVWVRVVSRVASSCDQVYSMYLGLKWCVSSCFGWKFKRGLCLVYFFFLFLWREWVYSVFVFGCLSCCCCCVQCNLFFVLFSFCMFIMLSWVSIYWKCDCLCVRVCKGSYVKSECFFFFFLERVEYVKVNDCMYVFVNGPRLLFVCSWVWLFKKGWH